MSIAKEKDLEKISWFENCLVGQLFSDGQYFAVGYDLSMVANEEQREIGIKINDKIREIISS